MGLLPSPGGVPAVAEPLGVITLDIDPSLVDNTAIAPALVVNGGNEDNNGNDNTVRHSRSDERSPSTDGGARRHSTSDDLRKQSFRMASAEREKKRKREKEIAYQNAKAKEERCKSPPGQKTMSASA